MKHNDRYNVISIFYCFLLSKSKFYLKVNNKMWPTMNFAKNSKSGARTSRKKTSCPRDVIMYVPVPVPSTANIGGTYGGVVPWYEYNTPSIPPRWYFLKLWYRVTYPVAIRSNTSTYVCGVFGTVYHFFPLGSGAWGGKGQYEGYLKGLVPCSTFPPKIYGIWCPKSSKPYDTRYHTLVPVPCTHWSFHQHDDNDDSNINMSVAHSKQKMTGHKRQ